MFEQDIFQGPGTGTFTTHTFEILFMLLVAALIGLWLGWVLWSRYRQESERLRVENNSLNITAATLRGDTDKLKKQLADAEAERATLDSQLQNQRLEFESTRNQLTVLESDMENILQRNRQLETELGLAKAAGTEPKAPDQEETAPIPTEPMEDLPDLETVIPEVKDSSTDTPDITPGSMAALAPDQIEETTPPAREEEEETPVVIAGPVPPNTEPAEQKEKPKKTKPKTKSSTKKAKEPVVVAVTGGPKDDLKIVEGIGPKIEELLFKDGITSYGQLAATGVQQLKSILDAAGPRFAMHDPGTWSAQALLAANGEWDNLKAYQDFLNAGKRPDK